MVKTVLLPWRDKIIYDGLVNAYSVYFGPGIRGSLNRAYQKVKDTTASSKRSAALWGQPVSRRPKKCRPSVEELLATLDRIEQELAGHHNIACEPICT